MIPKWKLYEDLADHALGAFVEPDKALLQHVADSMRRECFLQTHGRETPLAWQEENDLVHALYLTMAGAALKGVAEWR